MGEVGVYERRALLKFIAASPLLAAFPALAEALQQGGLEQAAHALDVFDFETAAQRLVPPAHSRCLRLRKQSAPRIRR